MDNPEKLVRAVLMLLDGLPAPEQLALLMSAVSEVIEREGDPRVWGAIEAGARAKASGTFAALAGRLQ